MSINSLLNQELSKIDLLLSQDLPHGCEFVVVWTDGNGTRRVHFANGWRPVDLVGSDLGSVTMCTEGEGRLIVQGIGGHNLEDVAEVIHWRELLVQRQHKLMEILCNL